MDRGLSKLEKYSTYNVTFFNLNSVIYSVIYNVIKDKKYSVMCT